MDAKTENRKGYHKEYYAQHKSEMKDRAKSYYHENKEQIRLRRKKNADAVALATEETIAEVAESIESFKTKLSGNILDLQQSIDKLEIRIAEIGAEYEIQMQKLKHEMENKQKKQTGNEPLTYQQDDVLNALGLQQKSVPSLAQ